MMVSVVKLFIPKSQPYDIALKYLPAVERTFSHEEFVPGHQPLNLCEKY